MKNLILVDTNYLVIRSFFGALNNIYSEDITRYAWEIILNKLLTIVHRYKSRKVIMVMDGYKSSIYRYRYSAYKATRTTKLPPQFRLLYDKLTHVCDILNLNVIRLHDLEADDTIACICDSMRDLVHQIFIFSEDKDMYQLLDSKVHMIKYNMDVLKLHHVLSKWGLQTSLQITTFQALCGDTSDNIPGVKGIGPKKAASILRQYDHFSNILKQAMCSERKSSLAPIRSQWRNFVLSWILVRLKRKSSDETWLREFKFKPAFAYTQELELFCLQNKLNAILDKIREIEDSWL